MIKENSNKKAFRFLEIMTILLLVTILFAILVPYIVEFVDSVKVKMDLRTCEFYARAIQHKIKMGELSKISGVMSKTEENNILGEVAGVPHVDSQSNFCYYFDEDYLYVYVGTSASAVTDAMNAKVKVKVEAFSLLHE